MRAQQLKFWARGLLSAAILLLLASACGGVDSGGTGAVSIGPITGFGSIIVNGARFDESMAAIQDDDGAPLARDRLMLGVMTQVDAFGSPGNPQTTARSVRVSSELVGPVSAVDPASGALTVLGQTVLLTPATVFDSSLVGGLVALQVGMTVEVHGRFDAANSRYTATRVEAQANPTFYKVRGPITAVDRTAAILTIGGQQIDYSRIPPSDLANVVIGSMVRAKLQPVPVSGVWIAVALPSGAVLLPDRAEAELEGRITTWTSTRQFSVDGIAVDASVARFPDGEAGIVLGARVSVDGTSSGGVLRARSVEAEGDEDENNSIFELHGAIDTIDVVAKTFMLRGIKVDYSGPVQYQSGSAADLAVGRQVNVSGTLSSDRIGVKAQRIAFGA